MSYAGSRLMLTSLTSSRRDPRSSRKVGHARSLLRASGTTREEKVSDPGLATQPDATRRNAILVGKGEFG